MKVYVGGKGNKRNIPLVMQITRYALCWAFSWKYDFEQQLVHLWSWKTTESFPLQKK